MPALFSDKMKLGRAERRAMLRAADLVAINGALLVYLCYRPDVDGLGFPAGTELDWRLILERPYWFVVLSALWLLFAHAFDAYKLQTARRWLPSSVAVLKAATATLGIYLAIPYVTPTLPPSRRYWLIMFGSAYLAVLLSRAIYRYVFGRSYFRRPTLIVGSGWAGQVIAETLLWDDDGTHSIVGFVDDVPGGKGQRVPTPKLVAETQRVGAADRELFRVLGGRHDLRELIRSHGIRTVVLAKTGEVDPELYEILTDCLELGVEMVPMTQLYERLTGRVPVEYVAGDWHLAMPLEHPGTGTVQPLLKRSFDLASASFGLLLLAPLVPLIAIAVRLESPGPIFYTQERIGKGGRTFRVFKFRSMRADAEKGDAVWAQARDPRITRVGRLLRATHVDEFPQFLNIVRGEMSAVGPRPERPEFLQELAAEIPFYTVRHAVRPGMAGWALVHCGYGASKGDALRKLQYDLYYIKNQSVAFDIVIILKTLLHSVGLQGR